MESFFTNIPWDIHTANMQPFYNVYALKNPLVYQDLEYGGQESPLYNGPAVIGESR